MLEWLEEIQYGKPIQMSPASASNIKFVTFLMDYHVQDVEQYGLLPKTYSIGKGILAAPATDYDAREAVARIIMYHRDDEQLARYLGCEPEKLIAFDVLNYLRPLTFYYSGQYLSLQGYLNGQNLDGVALIQTQISGDQVSISDRYTEVVIDLMR